MNIILLQSDASLFIGRFHPLVVHLPIGFLLLAIIFQFLSYFERFKSIKSSIPYMLFFGGISALISILLGFLLASQGGYNVEVLGWHKWLAIALAAISFLLWAWVTWGSKNRYITAILMTLTLIIVSVTGHLGGSLTHGEGYLFEYAPDYIRNQFIAENGIVLEKLPKEADSVLIYAHLIQPVLNQKCISCHNNKNKSGGLNLTSLDSLLKGGDNGEVVFSGSAINSELFKRVTINPKDRKFMPPNGVPLSYTETLLIQEWIMKELDVKLAISDPELSDAVKKQIQSNLGLDTRKKSFIEKLSLQPIDEEVLLALRKKGLILKKLSATSNAYDAKSIDTVTVEKLELLSTLREHIVWLDLSSTLLQDTMMHYIANFENVVKLDLHNNPITHVSTLLNLEHLEVLNLHSTRVNDYSVGEIEHLKTLKSLYLWQSEVSQSKADSLQNAVPNLYINFGSKLLVKADKSDSNL